MASNRTRRILDLARSNLDRTNIVDINNLEVVEQGVVTVEPSGDRTNIVDINNLEVVEQGVVTVEPSGDRTNIVDINIIEVVEQGEGTNEIPVEKPVEPSGDDTISNIVNQENMIVKEIETGLEMCLESTIDDSNKTEYLHQIVDEVSEGEDIDDSDVDKDYVPSDESSENEKFATRKPVSMRKRTVNREEKGIEGKPKKARSKDGIHSVKNRYERKQKRNTGEAYVTAKGKDVKAREQKELPKCRLKCGERIPEDARKLIFKEYWSLGSRNKRTQYVANLTYTKETATHRKRTCDPDKEKFRMCSHTYYFKINGQREKVCRGCFTKILGETHMFVTLAVGNSMATTSGVTYDDQRGLCEPSNKHSTETMGEVVAHIKSFPLYESHYTRRDNSKRFLPPHLNLQIMYKLYCENRDKTVSRRIYETEFHKLKLAFKQPKVDTCHKCDVLQMKLQVSDNEEEKRSIQEEVNEHHAEADIAYLKKDQDKNIAKENVNTRCYTFDLQQCLPTPFLQSSVAFYKRQLWTFNLTFHNAGSGEVTCYMWHEAEGGRGGNQIGTCIFQELLSLPPEVEKVILYSDTCGGQNKNSHVAAMFLTVMQKTKNLKVIDHKFMVSGHSHMECDVDHALIEKQKKMLSTQICHPHDWYQLVRSVGKKRKFVVKEQTHDKFLNFSDLYKQSLVLRKKYLEGKPFKWHDAKWFRYTSEPGKIFFKNSLDEQAPFKTFSVGRRGKSNVTLTPGKCYSSTLPVSAEKKSNLLDLLPLIPPVFKDFYQNLKTAEIEHTYPDIEEFDENETANLEI